MESRPFWLGAALPKRARESKFLALFWPALRVASLDGGREPEAGSPAPVEPDNGVGWTAGLSRGSDLPPLRLSIFLDSCLPEPRLPESGLDSGLPPSPEPRRRPAMRFEPFHPSGWVEIQPEGRRGR